MKKSLIYTLTSAALIISVAATATISSFATTKQTNPTSSLQSNTDLAQSTNFQSLSTSENIYIITNPDGSVNKSFTNNVLNTNSESLPLNVSISYFLDGQIISAKELIGKSGRVKITYTFTATKHYQDKLVPFLTVTGFNLDPAKFQNVSIDHGKIISESTDKLIIAGYTFAGFNEDLNTDLLPSSFTLSANVTNFEFQDTYTFATNELIADFDTTKLSSIDDLINSVNDLGNAFDQILAGSTELANGSNDLNQGAKRLSAGATDLAQGANQLSNGIDQLSSGAYELSQGADQLANGLDQLVAFDNSVLNKVDSTTNQVTATIQELIERYHIDPESDLIKRINASLTEYYGTAYSAVTTYTGNIEKLSDGANQLKAGANKLAAGTTELSTGADQLTDGAIKLANGATELANGTNKLSLGANTLNNGLTTFKQQGLDKLVNFANHDLSSFLANLRSTVAAADSYHHYSNPNAKSVKFIFKTPNIK